MTLEQNPAKVFGTSEQNGSGMQRYYEMIERVAYQVAATRAARAQGIRPEDIRQRVLLKIEEKGIPASYFDGLREPQASFRLYAKNALRREVEQRYRLLPNIAKGWAEKLVDYQESEGKKILREHPSEDPLPGEALMDSEFEGNLLSLAEDLISKVPVALRGALEAFYVRGEELTTTSGAETRTAAYSAAQKRLNRGKAKLHPDEEASLRGLRVYWHPDSRREMKSRRGGTPTALLDILAT